MYERKKVNKWEMPSYTNTGKSTDPPSHCLYAFEIQFQEGSNPRWDVSTSTLLPDLKIRSIIRGPVAAAIVDDVQKSRPMSVERVIATERKAAIGTSSTTNYTTNLSTPTGYDTY